MAGRIPLLLLLCALFAADFSARIIDGLGRPIPDVDVAVYGYAHGNRVQLLALRISGLVWSQP